MSSSRNHVIIIYRQIKMNKSCYKSHNVLLSSWKLLFGKSLLTYYYNIISSKSAGQIKKLKIGLTWPIVCPRLVCCDPRHRGLFHKSIRERFDRKQKTQVINIKSLLPPPGWSVPVRGACCLIKLWLSGSDKVLVSVPSSSACASSKVFWSQAFFPCKTSVPQAELESWQGGN